MSSICRVEVTSSSILKHEVIRNLSEPTAQFLVHIDVHADYLQSLSLYQNAHFCELPMNGSECA